MVSLILLVSALETVVTGTVHRMMLSRVAIQIISVACGGTADGVLVGLTVHFHHMIVVIYGKKEWR